MIGWVVDQLLEHIVEPVTVDAADPTVPEAHRVVLDPENRPLDSEAQELDVTPLTTEPLRGDLAGGLELRHTIMLEVDVQHGDPVVARQLRDGILLALALKAQAGGGDMMGATDPDTGQYVTRSEWSINYVPASVTFGNADTPIESAVMTFRIDTQLDR